MLPPVSYPPMNTLSVAFAVTLYPLLLPTATFAVLPVLSSVSESSPIATLSPEVVFVFNASKPIATFLTPVVTASPAE